MLNRMEKSSAGFTLIELIMVIVILGILAAVAVPKFFNLQDDAKVAAEMGVAGGVRSGIGIIHGSLITKYASGTAPATALTEVTGSANAVDADGDGWLDALQTTKAANATNLFEFVMNDPLAGGTDGGNDKWIMISATSYTGPASDATSGVADEANPETGKPDKGDTWVYTEADGTANNTGDGRFALVEGD